MKSLVFPIGILICVLASQAGFAQSHIIDGAYERSDISKMKPVPLPYVREADIVWSKKIWRIIDLREKMNQVLYFPTTEVEGRENLIKLLLEGIEQGTVTAYDARTDDEFKVPMAYEQVREAFGATDHTRRVRNADTGEYDEVLIKGQIHRDEVKQIMIKEEWYFDKQTSSLHVRIIGLCPIREYYREDDINHENVQRTQLFWVYYPEVRGLLASHAVFNPYNTASAMSFDDLFLKRRFSSYIVRESNVYNNRSINQYLSGEDAMKESQKIEQEIFDFEQDLWAY